MIVIDEAHHALAETYRNLFRRYPDAKKLGMTATPYRLSGTGFTDLFDTLLQSKSIPDFIMEKRLSLFDYYAVPQNSKIRRQIAMFKKRGADGDFQTKELELSLNTPRNIEYLAYWSKLVHKSYKFSLLKVLYNKTLLSTIMSHF